MTRRRMIAAGIWAVITISAIVWLSLGNLTSNRFGGVVFMLVAMLLGVGPAKAIAWWRLDHEDPLLPRVAALRATSAVLLVVIFGPAVASMAGWVDIVPAALCFFGGFIVACVCVALFSDGYQGLWFDSLIFFGRLAPPEDDYLLVRDANREAGRRKWSSEDGASE